MATKPGHDTYLQFWEEANAQEIGLYIKVDPEDQVKLINALYAARAEYGGYEGMIIFQPAPRGTLYIAHKTVELD